MGPRYDEAIDKTSLSSTRRSVPRNQTTKDFFFEFDAACFTFIACDPARDAADAAFAAKEDIYAGISRSLVSDSKQFNDPLLAQSLQSCAGGDINMEPSEFGTVRRKSEATRFAIRPRSGSIRWEQRRERARNP